MFPWLFDDGTDLGIPICLASIMVETLKRLKFHNIICPGSRFTPDRLGPSRWNDAILGARECSAAFFALGIARKSGLPVAIICTSETAGVNFYPAVIEASESRVCFNSDCLRNCEIAIQDNSTS